MSTTTPVATAATAAASINNPDMWQTYTSAKTAMRMLTANGKKITFTKFRFITRDQDCIDYLDKEIASGLTSVTKGEVVSSKDLDPMEALRKKAIADYLAEQELIAEGARDAGNTENAGLAKALGAATSKQVATA